MTPILAALSQRAAELSAFMADYSGAIASEYPQQMIAGKPVTLFKFKRLFMVGVKGSEL